MTDHPAAAPELTEAPSIDYRPYTRDDEEQILDLLRVAMKMERFPDLPGFWRWKHYENPFGESPGLVAIGRAEGGGAEGGDSEARAGAGEGKVVGLRVFLRWEWRGPDRVYRAVRAVDTATHPEWGRRGIFERMTTEMISRLTEEGVDFIFNTPNQYSMPGYLKMGWTLVGRLPLRVRPQRPTRVLKVAAQRSGLGGATAIDEPKDNSAVLELLRDPAVRALLRAAADPAARPGGAPRPAATGAGSPAGLHTVLTPAYLEWRYGNNRWYGYRAAFDSKGKSAALVVGRSSRRGELNELLVTDVVTLPDAASRRLAGRLAVQLARETAADYVAVSALGEELGLAGGFVPVGQRGPNLTVRPLRDGLDVDPRDFAAWAASFGDLELF